MISSETVRMQNPALVNVRYRIRHFLAQRDHLFWFLAVQSDVRRRMVKRNNDVLIEGFPRSGNSFFVTLFQYWNPEARVAHHIHAAAHVARGVRLGIPTAVLIRRPVDTLSSLQIFKPGLSTNLIIRSYIDFYRRLIPLKRNFIVANFESVTKRPDFVIEGVNRKFGTSFYVERFNEDHKNIIFARIKQHHKLKKNPPFLLAMPDKAKEEEKRRIYETIEASPSYNEAEDICNLFLNN